MKFFGWKNEVLRASVFFNSNYFKYTLEDFKNNQQKCM